MGMSTHIVGFKPPNEKFKQMKQVYDTCIEAGVKVPDEVMRFFKWDNPEDNGVEVDLNSFVKKVTPHDCADGFELHLDELDPDIKIIRFVNSY